jgi:hypothetical protein
MTMTEPAPVALSSFLANTAFGDDPARWPLPAASTPHELWLRAVAAGGQGRYGSALADLDALSRSRPGRSQVSLALSTRASFLRQLGWHTRARRWDGRAFTFGAEDPESLTDAAIGLAADCLGVGRFAAAQRFLQRARGVLADTEVPRLPVREAWVSAELAMACGDGGAAVGHAERAVELAAAFGSARHIVKSDVVLAAALCSAGAHDRSRGLADTALETAGRLGMVPLRWALACLLADIGSAIHPPQHVVAVRDECADTVRRRGGVWPAR